MINLHDNYWIPGEGFKYITNGEVFSDGIYLGKNDSIDNWHDTNDEPPAPEEEIPDEEALSILLGGDGE
ncbi:MAG: hypothetical protein IK149_01780 [Oscillospiraceae bacterium]|nr:hypothetical protein [Oscillospiraceae bacterium]